MAMNAPGRWPISTDGGTGSAMAGTAGPPTWVYRLADGTYLTVGPDEAGGTREIASADRSLSPDGFPIPPAWNRLAVRLPAGPATDVLVTDLEAAGGRPAGLRPVVATGYGGGRPRGRPGPVNRHRRAGRVRPGVGRAGAEGARGRGAGHLLPLNTHRRLAKSGTPSAAGGPSLPRSGEGTYFNRSRMPRGRRWRPA